MIQKNTDFNFYHNFEIHNLNLDRLILINRSLIPQTRECVYLTAGNLHPMLASGIRHYVYIYIFNMLSRIFFNQEISFGLWISC